MWAFHYTDGSWKKDHPPHRGLSFGDGTFETVRIQGGKPLFWEAHRMRMHAALQALALQLPCSWIEIERQVQALSRKFLNGRIKILVVRAGDGVYTPPTKEAHVWMVARSLSEDPSYPLGAEQSLILYPHRLLVETPWSRFKTLSALPYVQAAHYAAERGFSDAILLHVGGYVAETSRASLFWFDAEALCTPPLSMGAVSGILRAQVMTLAASLHIPLREAIVHPEALAQAREVFTANVIQGLAPVRHLSLSDQTLTYSQPVQVPQLAMYLRDAILSSTHDPA